MPSHSIESITERRKMRFEQALRRRQTEFSIVIENVWDPHNVSAILRSADAVGIHTVHLLYTVEDPPNLRKHGKMSSASAKKWLEIVVHRSAGECFAALHREGFTVYASHISKHSMGVHDIDFTRKTAIVLGNEKRGVSEESLSLSDGAYIIPMMGMVQSLNVSVAAAVSLYEGLRQRMNAGLYNTPQLGEDGVRHFMEKWAER